MTLQKSRARVLGTTFGVVAGYGYLESGIGDSVSQVVIICLLIFLSGLLAIQNDEFCRQTVVTFLVITFNYKNYAAIETKEEFAIHRFTFVVCGVLINLSWYFIYWFNSTRLIWNQALVDVIEMAKKKTRKAFDKLLQLEIISNDKNNEIYERPASTTEYPSSDLIIDFPTINLKKSSFIRENNIMREILNSDDIFFAELKDLDSKVKQVQLATIQLYDDPRIWAPKSLDQKHFESLITSIQRITRAVFWFSKYADITLSREERLILQPTQNLFKEHFPKLEKSFGIEQYIRYFLCSTI